MRRFSFLIAVKRIITYALTLALLFAILTVGREYWPTISKKLQGISTEQEIKVSVDKWFYSKGERVKITVENRTGATVFYAQSAACGASSWILENCLGDEVLYYQSCMWNISRHRFTKLAPGERLSFTWLGTGYSDSGTLEQVGRGCYKVVFPYSQKTKEPSGEGWGADKLEVQSRMFLIK